jgi:hypothetical protein
MPSSGDTIDLLMALSVKIYIKSVNCVLFLCDGILDSGVILGIVRRMSNVTPEGIIICPNIEPIRESFLDFYYLP